MPYARLANLTEEKRTRIMETAIDEFLELNFQTASINQISKKAGLSAGALYYYFEDKEDLFYTSLEYVTIRLMSEIGDMDRSFKENGYWESIESFVNRRLEFTVTYPKYMKLFSRILNSTDPVESRGKEKLLQPFHQIFTFGYENGYIRTDLPRNLMFSIHMNMILTVTKWSLDEQLLRNQKLSNLEDLSEKIIKMIKSAVGKEAYHEKDTSTVGEL